MRTHRQRLGQHFLRDERIALAIVEALPAEPPRVLEIGPGRGALTLPLLRRFPRVRALELDPGLAAGLARRLGEPAGLEVLHADALDAGLDELGADGPWLVAANLPYSVGTAIVRRLLPRHDLFPELVVMVQREVALRMVAPAGDTERGVLSVEVEAFADAELLFTVPARAFNPPPKVTSAVVRLRTRPPEVAGERARRALRLASVAFSHRRKKLANALASAVEPRLVADALAGLGRGDGVRPQELAWADWLSLAEALPAVEGEA